MRIENLRALQGRHINLAMADRTCMDGAVLQGVIDGGRLWLHADGGDVFVDLADVLDVWEPEAARARPPVSSK